MTYLIIELCCYDCLRFEKLFKINCENYLDLKQLLKDYVINEDSNNCFLIYDEECNFIDKLYFWG